ncbi:hypothetical protein [Pseudomonas oryzihabitans]|uniref:hypothetical protein n=1 Tax=Pseudomonas oryzihabitans TaxID=47885 RepID=UPI0028940A8C|nr:hypothetical protein [Pseudomonas oryzihabitans]MDT3718075.1 hypothetical protein [Pseudomonas oryzihabitans]
MSMQLPERDSFDPPALRLRRPFLTSLANGLGWLSLLAGMSALLVGGCALLQLPQLAPYLVLEQEIARNVVGGGALLLLLGLWLRRRSQKRFRYRNSLSLAPELKRRR